MIEGRLRRALLLLAGAVFAMTPLELWLTDHIEETQQLIPFAVCAAGLLAVALVLIRPARLSLMFLRVVMVVAVLTSLLGMYYHLSGNFGFELEIRPNDTASDVLMEALKGANPLLAPGILALAGAVALLAAWQHPQGTPRADS
jgi:hypothetical protein